MMKKMLVLALAGIMAISTLTGCKTVKTVDSEEVLMTVNGEEVKAGVANFYTRYTQAQYDASYKSYYGANMTADQWETEVSEGVTYEEYLKETALEMMQIMVLAEQHMSDYDVELTDADKEAIAKAVEEFVAENSKENRDKVSGDEASVERFLTLQTIITKMQLAIADTVDKNVTDEEAAQKKMEFVYFSYSKANDEGVAEELTDDEKEALKKDAELFVQNVKGGADFAKEAESRELTVEELTFDAESSTISAEAIMEADGLALGEVSDPVDTTNGIYVMKLVSEFDEEATDAKKDEIVEQRQSDEYVAVCQKWMEEAEIEVNEDVWAKVDFKELTINIIVEETEEEADSEETEE